MMRLENESIPISRLVLLPLEIWHVLSPLLTLTDFWSLVACGNRLMTQRLLSHSLITVIDLNDCNRSLVWKFLSLNRVDKLVHLLSSSYTTAQPHVAARLPFLKSWHWICGTERFLQLPVISEHVQLDPSDPNVSVFDLAACCPSLETFNFELTCDAMMLRREHHFILPESLTTLGIAEPGHQGFKPHLVNIPSQLTSLSLGDIFQVNESFIEILPKSITSLNAYFCGDEHWKRCRNFDEIEPPVELVIAPWVNESRLSELIHGENPPHWSDILPVQHHSFIDALEKLWKNRFKGWGSLRLLPRLRHLSAHKSSAFNGMKTLDTILLPSSLTSLEIGEFFCIERISQWPLNIKHLKLHENRDYLYNIPSHLASYSDQRLAMAVENNSCASRPCLWPSIRHSMPEISEMPHNLTYLALYSSNVLQLSVIGLLPRSLTHLDLVIFPCSNQDVLDLACDYSGVVLRKSDSPIPKSCQCASGDDAQRKACLATPKPSFWPPSLTRLALSHGCTLLLDVLPKSLTSYTIRTVFVENDLLERLAIECPHYLRSISFQELNKATERYYDSREDRKINARMRISTNLSFPIIGAYAETIDLYTFDRFHASQFSKFTKLHTLSSPHAAKIFEAWLIFHFLPTTIRYVDINCNANEMIDYVLLTVPNDLISLKIQHLTITLSTVGTTFASGDCGSELNETTLEASVMDLLDSFGHKVKIEEKSIYLALTPISSLSLPNTITSIDLPSDIGNLEFYSMLPSSLTNLRIIKPLKVDNKIFWNLPASLLHLTLEEDQSLTDPCTEKLPPNLKTFKLPLNAKLTNKAIKTLPKTIETLNLHSSLQIDDGALPHLPITLTDLDISWANISPAGLKLLPRGLRSLDIEFAEPLDETCDASHLPSSLTKLRAPLVLLSKCNSSLLPQLNLLEEPPIVIQTDDFWSF